LDKAGDMWYISLENNPDPLKKDYGTIKDLPTTGRILLNKEQSDELYQNPMIMAQFMKAMNNRLYAF
jgi:hypothetical protein